MEWNREQLEAAAYRGKILRVFGGPGAGKTRLAAAMAAECARGQPLTDETIVLVRTGKDAEILEREIFRIAGDNPVRVSTLTAFARRTFTPPSRVISGFQVRALLTDLLASQPSSYILKRAAWSGQLVNEIGDLLDVLRRNQVTPEKLPASKDDPLLSELKTVYSALEERIAAAGFITESAMMSAAAQSVKAKAGAVIVEDMQDITPTDYELLKALFQSGSARLIVFGDIYRNIHRFEGTDPEIMRSRMEEDFPAEMKTVHLRRSYTMGASRIELARNLFGAEAEPYLPREGESAEERVSYSEFETGFDEAVAVAGTAEELIRRRGLAPEEIAIVLRSPVVDGPRFRRALMMKGIPFNGGAAPFLPRIALKLLDRLGEFTTAVEISQKLPQITLDAARECLDSESALKALSAAAALTAETAEVLPGKFPPEIRNMVKDELARTYVPAETGGAAITSVHAAKGLKFKAVFIPGLLENSFPSEVDRWFIFNPRWLENLRLRVAGLVSYIERADLDRHLNEERRLFYTAVTLPAAEIYFSRPLTIKGEERNPSLFLFESGILPLEDNRLTEPWRPAVSTPLPLEDALAAERQRAAGKNRRDSAAQLTVSEPAAAQVIERQTIDHLSAGAVNTYLRCPRQFYYQYLRKIPTPATPAMAAGRILHLALEKIHFQLGELDPEPARKNLDIIIAELAAGEAEIETGSAEEEIITKYVHNKLSEYLSEAEFFGGSVLHLEKRIDWEPEPGLIFKGRIDRIDETENGVELIDYKMSGKSMHKALRTRFLDISHQEADLQLPIYCFAAEEARGLKVEYVTLLPLDFKHDSPRRIRFKVLSGDSESVNILPRKKLEELREDLLSLARKMVSCADFSRSDNTSCRNKYSRFVCPFISICDIAE